MELLMNEDVDRKEWKEFCLKCGYGSAFQMPEFYDLFNAVEGYSADVFAVREKGDLAALMVVTVQKEKGIKGFFSRRGIIFGGPLITDKGSASFILESVSSFYKNKLIYIEIRNLHDYGPFKEAFSSARWQYTPWLNYRLKVDDFEQIKEDMSSRRMRQIRKAKKTGVEWMEADKPDEIREFYDLLSDLYRYKVKKPLPPWPFFKTFFDSGLGKFLLIKYKEEIIGGIMCPVLENQAVYLLYVAGKDNEYKHQYPGIMANWAAIEYALDHGIPMVDFMGAGHPDDKYGVREFKARFGGEEVEFGRFSRVLNPALFGIGKIGLKLLQKTPA